MKNSTLVPKIRENTSPMPILDPTLILKFKYKIYKSVKLKKYFQLKKKKIKN